MRSVISTIKRLMTMMMMAAF